jgi:hypothetical protein
MTKKMMEDSERVMMEESPPVLREKVMAVLNRIDRGGRGRPCSLLSACKKAEISVEEVNDAVRTYKDLNRAAVKAGLRIGGVKVKRMANSSVAISGETSVELSKPKSKGVVPWTPDRDSSILSLVECLEKGLPWSSALRYAGVTQHQLNYWYKDDEALKPTLLRAEAKWAKMFFEKFNEAITNAAIAGKVEPFIQIASKRFINSWGDFKEIERTLEARADDSVDSEGVEKKKENKTHTIIIEGELE